MADVTQMKSEAGEPPKAMTLSDLGKKIRTEHEALTSAIRGIVNRAIAIGEDLNKAKALVGHGSFLKWVKLNCAMTNKTGQRYMNLASTKDVLMAKLRELVTTTEDEFEMLSNLSLAQAERLIAGEGSKGKVPTPSDLYDNAEGNLIKKLADLRVDVAEAAVNETIARLQSAIALMKRVKVAA